MSTFKGFVTEFPQIRIDYFRTLPDRPMPLACFLSHIHSDHLVGLESLKSPFVYCSPATREILLRLEKYPHRMNFTKGILESRKQTYTHLKNLLKPIPLETPTQIELTPGCKIQVTLFDANHCVGAVMFLIEDENHAVLYTGDIRSEKWMVNMLARHPKLLPYTSGGIRKLDTIYLDTTFATTSEPYKEFPTKAEGLTELLRKLAKYPATTTFYFHAWTFGYEEVWLTLSQALGSRIHLDRYRYCIYSALARNCGAGLECREAPALCGFKIGNTAQPGIITTDHSVRLHSCELGTGCPVLEADETSELVHIKPIISRHAGQEISEMGLGGGQGDLDQRHELDLIEKHNLLRLADLYNKTEIPGEAPVDFPELLAKLLRPDSKVSSNPAMNGRLRISQSILLKLGDQEEHNDIPIDRVLRLLRSLASQQDDSAAAPATTVEASDPAEVTFTYSRHSSYSELQYLVAAFRPRDVWPCTAPPPEEYTEEKSMEFLFGDLCDAKSGAFAWDNEMRLLKQRQKRESARKKAEEEGSAAKKEQERLINMKKRTAGRLQHGETPSVEAENMPAKRVKHCGQPIAAGKPDVLSVESDTDEGDNRVVMPPRLSSSGEQRLKKRKAAFNAAGDGKWMGLMSTARVRQEEEDEL